MLKYLMFGFIILFVVGINGFTQNQNASPSVIRIMAYNIHHGEGVDGVPDLDRIARVISAQNPHLVTLQEVDKLCTRSGSVNQAAELGRKLGMDHIFGKAMDFQGGEYGLAVLSKLPIIKSRLHHLSPGDEPRRALEVQIRVRGYPAPISIISVHNSWNSEAVRTAQTKELIAVAGKYSHPVILAGDFNSRLGEPPMNLLKKGGFDVPEFKFQNINLDSQIDFFVTRNFPRKGIRCRVLAEAKASDHRPILAEIILNED